ncbi:polysaccharide biosynthesis protein [Sporomusa acidovorans]|uniref:UDP-N-acetyl-alpha-D-glucosamine C6 dehydratase n=1 Tax=Sporomusa acidovorans (strain ATCC 49682 / DSM 3132 / Mol) TaxID=1123286 RepID=A0ABZ3IYJ7_SPOA4|nr:nucleoside-diphosphate sugar epimerase/dehydratase [Sporomusa acidovorans]OZC17233.1 UDP-N-acetyl-alpha-D-glucosamine C6 dehydratase [Sporomusa acidovorans DSM 3132]SDF15300.1 NDP-sugar epimerase, includes UDP-GlcNAc-inverting 4,6-dehydratase FlaA1 and capsular polysaccharide biosynthesis protein EpsC [Sporomusa acidovorans]
MRRNMRLVLLVLIDIAIVSIVPLLALIIRFEEMADMEPYFNILCSILPVIITVRLLCFYSFGLYHRLWRYASINELFAIGSAVTVSSIILAVYTAFVGPVIPRSIHFISWIFTIFVIGFSRLCLRILFYLRHKRSEKMCCNVLIVGAGDAGAMIAREIKQRYHESKKLVGFVDDDPYKQNKMMFGIKILGGRSTIRRFVNDFQVQEIIIALPSAGGNIVRDIVQECKDTGCAVKTLPGIYELLDGKVTIQQLRDVDVEDLLKREPVRLNLDEIAGYITGKKVLVTGAGGSIGSELCRQIAKLSPGCLCLLGKGENSIYEIDRELGTKFPQLDIRPIIADIRDKERMDEVFSSNTPQVVFHAAAHKHVPLMEMQPKEAVRNNIFGTKVLAEAADKFGAEVFVMVSTDKAVNPTSVMGATKRVAELVIQSINHCSNTKFVAVRFGNVLGSRGSVIPLFKKQIAAGGPITITHPDMRRYFMTIPEAVQLILQAGSMAKGGEVFVLDMGKPVKIVDLARDLIELSGLIPSIDIAVEYTGIRPGEKLFEELLTADEGTNATKHEKIFVANIKAVDEVQFSQGIIALRRAVNNNELMGIIRKMVPMYSVAILSNNDSTCNQATTKDGESNGYARSYQTAAGMLR